MPARKGSISPVIRYIRNLSGGPYFTINETAGLLGVSRSTLNTSMNRYPERFGAFAVISFGSMKIPVFTEAEVERARESYQATKYANPDRIPGKRGRPRLWTHLEANERSAASSRASYCRRRARQLISDGEPELAAKAEAEGDAITAGLRTSHAHRLRELAAAAV